MEDEVRFEDVTGVILAGGQSRRMGRDKPRLRLDGVSLFERMLGLMRGLFPRVLIAGDRPDLSRPGVPSVPDRFPGSALGGLHTGLSAAETPFVFAAASDMPFPSAALARALLAAREGADAVVIQTPRGLEPLFAVYSRRCLDPMREALQARRYRIATLLEPGAGLRVRVLTGGALPAGWERALSNLNTARDLERAARGGAP